MPPASSPAPGPTGAIVPIHYARPVRELDVAVVIVAYNSEAVIGRLLDSLPAGLAGCEAAVVVVDNGSADGTVAAVEAWRGPFRPVVVRESNRGYAAGINAGVRAAPPSRAVLVLNPDLEVHPGAAAHLLSRLGGGVAAVAPKVLEPSGALSWSLRRDPTLLRAIGLGRLGLPAVSEYCRRGAEYEHAHDVDWALGAALLVDRTVHDRLGGWDESYFLYSEETDLCLRIRAGGQRVAYEPSAVVVHIGKASGYSHTTHALLVVNRVRLYRRFHGPVASFGYLLAVSLQELSWWARGAGQSRTALRALWRPSTRPPQLGASGHLLPR